MRYDPGRAGRHRVGQRPAEQPAVEPARGLQVGLLGVDPARHAVRVCPRLRHRRLRFVGFDQPRYRVRVIQSDPSARARGPLGVGERAADFVLTGPAGVPARFYAHAGGRPTAVVFDRDGGDPRLVDLADRLAGRDGRRAVLRHVERAGRGRRHAGVVGPRRHGRRRLRGDARRTDRGRARPQPARRRRRGRRPPRGARSSRCSTARSHRDPAVQVAAQAPVLLLPRVLDAAYRERLIRVWEREGGVETGVARASGDVLDASYKRRRDHTVGDPRPAARAVLGGRPPRAARGPQGVRVPGDPLRGLQDRLLRRRHRRLLPAAPRQPDAVHRRTGCSRSRSTSTTATRAVSCASRSTATSSTGPMPGAALVFSCAHLHEVRDVTAGRRFVLLSFLYGDPGAR